MELFVAIGLNYSIARRLHDFASDHLHGVQIEYPQDMHITLRYIGHTERVNEIMERLSYAAYPSFSLQLSHADAFMNPGENVIWQGLHDPDDHLPHLHTIIDDALEGCQVLRDEKPFNPHITLAFTNSPIKIDYVQALALPEVLEVERFELWCVLPTPCPYRFRRLASYRLSDDTQRKTVRLLCINDFHAELYESGNGLGAGKLVQAVHEYVQDKGNTVVVFGGDNYFGDPLSELYQGKPVIELMNAVNVVASVAGNHDFDFPVDTFAAWEKEGGIPVLAANIIRRGTYELPEFVRPYHMIDCAGVKIALIGLATVEPMDGPDRPREWTAYELVDGTAAARKWADYLNAGNDPCGKPDAIVALTHFGLRETSEGVVIGDEMKRLADKVPELSGAFAAHWHRFLQLTFGNVAIAEGGSNGRGFAVLALTFGKDRKLLSGTPLVFNLMHKRDKLLADSAITSMVDSYFARAQQEMGQTIAVAEMDIIHRDPGSKAISMAGTPLTLLATEVMREATGCPIALIYAGRIIGGFKKGPITLYQFYQVYPFANVIVTAQLTGRQIRENIEIGMRTLPEDGASPLAVGGLIVTLDAACALGQRVKDVRFSDGRPLDMEADYPVVLEEYLASDPLGFRFSEGKNYERCGFTLRNLMLSYFKQHHRLDGKQPDNIILQNTGGQKENASTF